MKKRLVCLACAVVAMACLSQHAWADPIVPIGYVSYDVTGTNVAEFDITNLTGPNSLSPIFPVTSSLDLTDLSLTVYFAGNVSVTYGSSYFTLAGDGLSWNGDQLSTLNGAPTGLLGAISATLTGTFVENTVQFNGISTAGIEDLNFSAAITDSSGFLQDGDYELINATITPEPSTWLLLATGVLGFLILAGGGRFKRRLARVLPFACLLLLLPAASHAQSAVTLSTVTTPSTGTSGGTVSINGSGYPSGTITPAEVSIGVAATCGNTETSATPVLVTDILGPVYKIAFTVPGLSAGTYYISISGTTSTGNSFASSNCAKLVVLNGVSPTLSIDTSRGTTDWIIKNGAMTIDYNATGGGKIWSIVPTGTSDQIVDFDPGTSWDPNDGTGHTSGTLPAAWNGPLGTGLDKNGNIVTYPRGGEPKGFYMGLSGFTSTGTETSGYTLTSDYLDFWGAYPAYATSSGSTSTIVNSTEYEEHFVVTPNDPGIHFYFSLNHPATAPVTTGPLAGTNVTNSSGTIGGQVQWVFRSNAVNFPNFYQKLADLSMVNGVTTPMPSSDDCFSSDASRNDQDLTGYDTIDLHPEVGVNNFFSPYPNGEIPEGFHRHFCVKYDFSSYEYIHQGQGLFGSEYGEFVALTPGHDTMIDGPSKENLNLTTNNILTIEPNSNHYRTGGVGTTSIAAGTAYGPRIYGPFYVRISQIGMSTISTIDGGTIQNQDDMYNDAIAAAASFTNFYDNESVLVSKGYVPSMERGSVAVSISGVSGAPSTAWAVLAQNQINHENSTKSHQYTIDISANGTGTFTNVVPGTYRLSVFDFGQWGEYRQDNVVVTAGNTTTVSPITFQPENFGTVVGTIGTPDRSAHEFLHGAYTQNYADGPLGYDDREYPGAWNYWADFASTNGVVIYNLTDGSGYTATNNPLAWNYAHWYVFNPGLYGGDCIASQDEPSVQNTIGYQDTGCVSLGDNIGIPAYVSGLPGASGTSGVTTKVPAWQIHFTLASNPASGYVVLSNALASSQVPVSVSLNGTTALTYTPGSSHYSDAIERSGLSGYTEWIAFQWPVSALNAAGADNVITITAAGSGTTFEEDSDDALRLELSTNGANPTVTGWHDYSFVTSGTTTAASDTVPNP